MHHQLKLILEKKRFHSWCFYFKWNPEKTILSITYFHHSLDITQNSLLQNFQLPLLLYILISSPSLLLVLDCEKNRDHWEFSEWYWIVNITQNLNTLWSNQIILKILKQWNIPNCDEVRNWENIFRIERTTSFKWWFSNLNLNEIANMLPSYDIELINQFIMTEFYNIPSWSVSKTIHIKR